MGPAPVATSEYTRCAWPPANFALRIPDSLPEEDPGLPPSGPGSHRPGQRAPAPLPCARGRRRGPRARAPPDRGRFTPAPGPFAGGAPLQRSRIRRSRCSPGPRPIALP